MSKPIFVIYINNTIAFLLLSIFRIFLKPINNGENLLFINTGQIGDLIVSSIILDKIDLLKKKYNKCYFLLRKEYRGLFENMESIEFIYWSYRKYKYNLFYRIKFLLMLRKLNLIVTFNLTAARGVTVDELSLLSGSKNIYALNSNFRYLTKLFGKKLDQMYIKILAENILNEYDKNIEVLKYFGIDYQFNRTSFKKANIENHKNYKYEIAVAPFSSTYNRDWGTEKFKKLISKLADTYKVLLLGSLDQNKKLEKFRMDSVSISAGKLNFKELFGQIENVKLFIGLDSGLSHIALKVGTPFIAIIGGGNFGRFFPYNESSKARYLYHNMECFGCEWRCIHKEPYCLTEITVDEVLKNVNEILEYYENS